MLALTSDRFIRCVSVIAGTCCASGCHCGAPVTATTMQARDPAARVAAIQRAANTQDTSLLPHLVDRLDDEDSAVRFTAIIALEKLTGKRLAYRYDVPSPASVASWRRFIERRRAPTPNPEESSAH